MDDPYQLERFCEVQDAHDIYGQALRELRHGHKTSHWMWFVFPQIAGLGSSVIAQKYALRSIDEAKAYLAHPVLGARLLKCSSVLLGLGERSAADVFGTLDAKKLRSSMTLFAHADPECEVFQHILGAYFNGVEDATTLQKL